jgi:hypothetical protein
METIKLAHETPPFTPLDSLDSSTPETPSGDPLIPGEYLPLSDAQEWLQVNLHQDKADRIFNHLWMAGTPKQFDSLSKHRVYGRKVVPSESTHLHLVWVNEFLYIKPLPPCLTNFTFFEECICGNKKVYTLAAGLLFSYCHLICAESDFRIAIEHGLIRATGKDELTWEKWARFRLAVQSYLGNNKTLIAKRHYRYGTLRLARLNIIYFFRFGRPAGYHNRFTQYLPFFNRYFGAAILLFAFASVTLDAMQVLSQQTTVPVPLPLGVACYRFAVVILIAVAGIIGSLIMVFIPRVAHDLSTGLIAARKEARTFRRLRASSTVSEAEKGQVVK